MGITRSDTVDKNLQTYFATAVGVALILAGIIGFISDPLLWLFTVNSTHNLVHLVLGVFYVLGGVWCGTRYARLANQWNGVALLAVAAAGFAGWVAVQNALALNLWGDWLHLILGATSAAIGFFAK